MGAFLSVTKFSRLSLTKSVNLNHTYTAPPKTMDILAFGVATSRRKKTGTKLLISL